MINYLYLWWTTFLSGVHLTPETFNILFSLFMGGIATLNGWQLGCIVYFALSTFFFIGWAVWGLPTNLLIMNFMFSFIIMALSIYVDKNSGGIIG